MARGPWTRRDLARNAHVDEGTLCELFAGRRRPTFGTLRALCLVLELSLDEMIKFMADEQLDGTTSNAGQ